MGSAGRSQSNLRTILSRSLRVGDAQLTFEIRLATRGAIAAYGPCGFWMKNWYIDENVLGFSVSKMCQ
jgi:hypothetical protein